MSNFIPGEQWQAKKLRQKRLNETRHKGSKRTKTSKLDNFIIIIEKN